MSLLKRVIKNNVNKIGSKLRRRHKRVANDMKINDKSKPRQKHVVVISQFYRPEPTMFPPAIAEALRSGGFRVSVVTGYPNRPDGILYPEYVQRFGYSEEIDGVEVHRVPLFINYSRNGLKRVVNFLSFSFNALFLTRMIKRADLVYVYATPATVGLPAQLWRRLLGVPYILHVQDLWPESVTDSGMLNSGALNRFIRSCLDRWLKNLYRNAAHTIAISLGMKKLLVERGSEAKKTSVIYNWAHEASIKPKLESTFSPHGQLNLLYAGTLGPMQDLETVVKAAARFDDRPGFTLRIAGGGIMEDKLHSLATGLHRTKFLGRLPRTDVGNLYTESDFQLVTLKDLAIFRATVPSKLQASLASGVPVITTVSGDVATLVKRYNAGLVADPENITSLSEAFNEALNMSAYERARMGRNARKLYEEHMSHSAGSEAIAIVAHRVMDSKIYEGKN